MFIEPLVLACLVFIPWMILGVGCWVGYQLVQQNGRILGRLDALEPQFAQLRSSLGAAAQEPPSPTGLPVGILAPEFELPDLAGQRRALSSWRGRRILLIFFNPRCGFCQRMAPDLAALPSDGAEGRPLPVVVTGGDAADNRAFFGEHAIRCPVLVQEQMEVASEYRASGTPMGYLIDEEGQIASEVAVGAPALLRLAAGSDALPPTQSNGHGPRVANRSLADSRLNRSGLKVGTAAPEFQLPRLDGGEQSLQEFRGRKVLLVFSDPHCGPCDQLAPRLEEHHRRARDVQVLMISRGEPEDNQQKVTQHRLTFPVLLQKQWEISRLYAMFATPIAYLIDEQGVIAADVASGPDPILTLLSSASQEVSEPSTGPCRCGRTNGRCKCGKKRTALAR